MTDEQLYHKVSEEIKALQVVKLNRNDLINRLMPKFSGKACKKRLRVAIHNYIQENS